MAEIKIDYMNYCNVNMSSPNSCNSSNLNQQNKSTNDQNNLNNYLNQKNINNNELNKINNQINDQINDNKLDNNSINNLNGNKSNTSTDLNNLDNKQSIDQNESKNQQQQQQIDNFDKSINNLKFLNNSFVTQDDIGELLKAFQERAFKSAEYRAKDEKIQLVCLNLFNYDYRPDELLIINNSESDLSGTYPVKLIIPKTNAFPVDCERLRNLFSKAKYARCRCRFPVPIILFNNKYVCRSATLSHCIEIYSNKGIYANLFRTGEEEQIQDIGQEIKELNLDNLESLESPNFDVIDTQFTVKQDDIDLSISQNIDKTNGTKSNGYFSAFRQDYSHTVNEARAHDIALLNYLNVKHIIDLMVEMKKVKYGLNVASSEKADKLKRYRDFNIIGLPYPGCEFFKSYRDNNYQAEGLIYDWAQNFVDADLNIPESELTNSLQINFDNYKKWDLNNLTLNYLKLILTYLVQPNTESILLHCISGWDRTPGFSSLIRLSLWADYELHQNLNHEQILYLTLAYDWYLFGHDLNDRVEKGEVIMHYCFYFLKFLSSIEHSIDYLRKNIVKKGNEYVRVRYNCCDLCKQESSNTIDKQKQKQQQSQFNDVKNKIDETKLSVLEIDEEISSSMYSSQASTVVNNNLKKDQILNHFNTSGSDTETNSSGNQTPKDGLINSCFLITSEPLQLKQEENNQQQSQSKDNKQIIKSLENENQDVVDHVELTNGTISTKLQKQQQQQQQMFIIDSNFDQNISASPSTSFSMYKDLRNNSINSLNRNSLTIENTDINKFDVISLDDQSISSNSSYDVLNAVNKQQQQQVISNANNINKQQSTLNNQSTINYHSNSTSQQSQNGLIYSSNQQQLKNNNLKQQESLNKHNVNNNCELIRSDSFSCGPPPKLVSNICNIDDEEEEQNLHLKSKLIQDDEDDDDILSSSCESNTLAEEDVDTVDCKNNNSNIQRSIPVTIPSRNRQNNFNSSSISENENLNWSNEYNSNNSNLSNASNRLSDQSFNSPSISSWQLVTDTGSVRKETFLSSTSLDDIKRNMNSKLNSNQFSSPDNKFNRLNNNQSYYVPTCCCKNINCGKYCEKIEQYNKENDLEKFIYTRAKRLGDVRVVFYQCYSKYIGLTTNACGNEITSKFHNIINRTSNIIKFPFRTGNNGNNFTRNSNIRLSQQNNRKSKTQFQSYIEDNLNDKNENS